MTGAWVAAQETAASGRSAKYVIRSGQRTLAFDEVIAGWRDNSGFRAFYCDTLASAPWPAFFWEMPPIRRGHTSVPYEFMLIGSDALAGMEPDAQAFVAQFEKTEKVVATFPNLGGDAELVVPKQIAAPDHYAHLAAFVRSTSKSQQQDLFQALGEAIDGFLARYDGRLWISTSGLGIAWVHVRLDTYPKYYQHQPYTRA